MKGRIHLYCGDGKGKTTAATGLAVRAAGAGRTVLFASFFKDGRSSETQILRQIVPIELLFCEKKYGLYKYQDETARRQATVDYTNLLETALSRATDGIDLLVLDEVVSACNHNVVSEDRLVAFLENKPTSLEVVMTGRNPSQALLDAADYVTEMKKIKHPYDCGIGARQGIEF